MTLAPMLYRASPVDHLRSVSTPHLRSDLDKFSNPISFGSRGTSPLSSHAVSATEISRPSSTSTQGSHSAQHLQLQHSQNISSLPPGCHSLSLPGLSALASIASAPSAQLRSFSNHATPSRHYATIAGPAPASLAGNTPPVCQNCQTSTTPLWRRDELGSVLCNACGLFLKLHGRPRPISLKTDVIKSRNRVKSTVHGQKKRSFEVSGLSVTSEGGTPLSGMHLQRRPSQKLSSGASDRSHSPISRTGTPGTRHDPNIAPPHLFDSASLHDHSFQASPSLPSLQLSHPSPGSNHSVNDRHLEPPQNLDHLFSVNSQLKTRVNELELINIMRSESEARLQRELDAVRRSEDELKRRIRQLEQRLDETQDHSSDSYSAKRTRLSDPELYQ